MSRPAKSQHNKEMLHRCILLFLSIVFLLSTSCVRAPIKEIEWPEDIPPLSFFETAYEQDEENREVQPKDNYLLWVVRFYKGWELYDHGWQSTTRDILYNVEDTPRRTRIETKLTHLGKLISAEWAKDSPNRLIRSRQLSVWGEALLASIDRKTEEKLVDLVTRDVNALLAGELSPDRIILKRY